MQTKRKLGACFTSRFVRATGNVRTHLISRLGVETTLRCPYMFRVADIQKCALLNSEESDPDASFVASEHFTRFRYLNVLCLIRSSGTSRVRGGDR